MESTKKEPQATVGSKLERNPNCPICPNPTASTVIETPAPMKKGGSFRRRRTYECSIHPAHRFTTDETLSLGSPMLVKKGNGSIQFFDYGSLVGGLVAAATPAEEASTVDRIAAKVTHDARKLAQARLKQEERNSDLPNLPVTSSEELGGLVLKALRDHEHFAMWIRFTLIHKKVGEGKSIGGILEQLKQEWHKL